MKAKVLLSTMVFAAAFAGCSQDEWGENGINTSNENRRAVGEVVLSLSEPSTRMEAVTGENGMPVFEFSADDKIGGHLMDTYNGNGYWLTNNINTNYPFQQEGEDWKSTGVLLEGNYFFSYPFNGCQQDRGALVNTVPIDQYAYPRDEQGNQTGDVEWYQSFLDNQFYLGYSFLTAEENCTDCDEVGVLNVSVQMEPVHAYPVFEVVNKTGSPLDKPMKVYKISLRKADESLFYNTVAVFPQGKKFDAETVVPGEYTLWNTAVYNRNMGDHVNAWPLDAEKICKSRTLEYNLHFPEGGYEVQNWDSFKACMIVPAGLYGKMEVLIYTNEGIIKAPIDMPNNMVDSGTWKFDPTKAPKFTIKADICEVIDNQVAFTVQSTENLVEYLSYIAQIGNATKVAVKTVGNEVELNTKAYSILKNENMKLELNGTLVIPAEVPQDAIDRIDFYKDNGKSRIINLGTQVIEQKPVNDKVWGRDDVYVRIENYGTLTLKADMPISRIDNFGTLNVEESSVYALVNMPENDGVEPTVTVSKKLNAIMLLNFGAMNVNEGAEVNVLSKWFNYGTTDNKGTINTWPADWSNPAFMSIIDVTNISEPELNWLKTWLHGKLTFDVTATAEVYNAFIAASAEAVNMGTINNEGTINSKGVIIRNGSDQEYTLLKDIIHKKFAVYEAELVVEETTMEIAAVTSLVNYGYQSEITNAQGAQILNLSNFGKLVPKRGSYTSLVEVEADNLAELTQTLEAAEVYLQGALAFQGKGLIDMTDNDGVAQSSQAYIDNQEEELKTTGDEPNCDSQIVYVLREGDKASFNHAVAENNTSAPKYINTIWLNNGSDMTLTKDTSVKGMDLWLTGNNSITVQSGVTLTLGSVGISGVATIAGDGTVELTDNIYVAAGSTFNARANNWEAKSTVYVWGYDSTSVLSPNAAMSRAENIELLYQTFDYVGPWIVID